MSDLLDRPGDEPAPEEESAIERLSAPRRREVKQVNRQLEVSRKRCLAYLAAFNYQDYRMERNVQDRLLGRLYALMPSIQVMRLDEAYRRADLAEAS